MPRFDAICDHILSLTHDERIALLRRCAADLAAHHPDSYEQWWGKVIALMLAAAVRANHGSSQKEREFINEAFGLHDDAKAFEEWTREEGEGADRIEAIESLLSDVDARDYANLMNVGLCVLGCDGQIDEEEKEFLRKLFRTRMD